MLNIVLVEPEIPQNCGNIARTCAATGSRLHLVQPLGFDISEKAVRRAGLDYWHLVDVCGSTRAWTTSSPPSRSRGPVAGHHQGPRAYTPGRFHAGCWLFFGKETAGLPLDFRERYHDRCLRLPMRPEARSLNLANSVAVLVYEALRQQGFPGLRVPGRWRSVSPARATSDGAGRRT